MPFVLWLMGGLVPWFYFQEVLNGGTGVLDEYSYLVKKVVFQIDALPVVKLISALFTHAFCGIYAGCFAVMGFYPDLYVLQVVLLFVLHGDVYGRTDLCDKRRDGVFP